MVKDMFACGLNRVLAIMLGRLFEVVPVRVTSSLNFKAGLEDPDELYIIF